VSGDGRLRVLFATRQSHFPQRAGGSPSTTHELCIELADRHVVPAVLATLEPEGWLGFWNRMRRKLPGGPLFPADRRMGYVTYRGWDPVAGAGEVCRRFRPDVAVLQAGRPLPLANALLEAGVPTVLYIHDVDLDQMDGSLGPRRGLAFVANSRFTAARVREARGIEATTIPPLVRPEHYRTETTRERVLFVNPHPRKGVEVAFRLAEARPDIPFEFLRAWRLRPDLESEYRERARRAGNIDWRESVMDMRGPYGRARLALVPSQLEEAWGRIATEAQASGIPVLASDRGGLPESVGSGGLLVPHDAPIGEWLEALSRVWDDPDTYDRLSRAALEHSRRPEIQPPALVARLLDLLQRHARSAVR
jgi:glycosyltransferase involved in cell wall biosynthesis